MHNKTCKIQKGAELYAPKFARARGKIQTKKREQTAKRRAVLSLHFTLQTIELTSGDAIGDWAFEGCTGLTSETIGSSVTSIGDNAFEGCSGLAGVTFEDTAGWYADNTSIDVTNPTNNATMLASTYVDYSWERNP